MHFLLRSEILQTWGAEFDSFTYSKDFAVVFMLFVFVRKKFAAIKFEKFFFFASNFFSVSIIIWALKNIIVLAFFNV